MNLVELSLILEHLSNRTTVGNFSSSRSEQQRASRSQPRLPRLPEPAREIRVSRNDAAITVVFHAAARTAGSSMINRRSARGLRGPLAPKEASSAGARALSAIARPPRNILPASARIQRAIKSERRDQRSAVPRPHAAAGNPRGLGRRSGIGERGENGSNEGARRKMFAGRARPR